MKKFSINYGKSVLSLIIVALILCTVGLAWNIYNLVSLSGVIHTVSYSILSVIILAMLVECFALLFHACYKIKGEFIYSYFGLIFFKLNLKKVVCATVFKKTNKLVLYFNDQTYSAVIISPKDFDQFLSEIKSAQDKIIIKDDNE